MERYKDRVLETTISEGTGSIILLGGVEGHQTFSILSDGDDCFYTIYTVDSRGNPTGEWEVGKGVYSSGVIIRNPPHLRLTAVSGSDVVTPDSAAFALLNDIDIRALIFLDDWTPAREHVILSKYAGSARELMFGVANDLIIFRRGDGASTTGTAVSTAATGVPDGEWKWIRATHNVASTIVKLYTSDDGITWTQLGADRTISVTPGNGTQSLQIGAWNHPLSADVLSGGIQRVQIRDGIDGTLVTDLRFDIQPTMTSSITDDQGNIWSFRGGAGIKHGPIASSNNDSLVDFSAGTKWVFLSPTSDKLSLPNVQRFPLSGTWVKPYGARFVEAFLVGGGGSGGSGRKGAATTGRAGGGGGGGGGIARGFWPADSLNATEAVVVGLPTTGGISQTTNSTNGNNGTIGNPTTFKTLRAAGGGPGLGGTSVTGSAGAAGGTSTLCSQPGGVGGTGSSVNASTAGAIGTQVPTGGGAGGGISTADALVVAVNGGTMTVANTTVNPVATAGGLGGSPGSSGNTKIAHYNIFIGTGGGGGSASITGDAFSGGNGADYGAGGGGGGAALDNVGNSGPGGNGAGGYAVIITK